MVTPKIRHSFCESITGIGPWHIRRLTEFGRRLGGGIDTPSLCGRINSGWDLDVEITSDHLKFDYICPKCSEFYRAERPKTDEDYRREVERMKAYRRMIDDMAKRAILDYIDFHGEGYTRDFRNKIPLDLSIQRIGALCRGLEKEGMLESELRHPPFKDSGRHSIRRYYRRKKS